MSKNRPTHRPHTVKVKGSKLLKRFQEMCDKYNYDINVLWTVEKYVLPFFAGKAIKKDLPEQLVRFGSLMDTDGMMIL